MKTKILFSAIFSMAIIGFTSCSKDERAPQPTAAQEAYVDATSKTTWHYYSLSKKEIVGKGEENVVDNAAWAARKDWDIAINRYLIRTNSGEATTVKSQGGVYVCAKGVTFLSLTSLPTGITFASDQVVTSGGMSGTTSIVQSKATVITFQKNEDGSMVMPPVYLKAPIYIFRTANGADYYKVEFTQYQNEKKVTGHVKFNSAQIK